MVGAELTVGDTDDVEPGTDGNGIVFPELEGGKKLVGAALLLGFELIVGVELTVGNAVAEGLGPLFDPELIVGELVGGLAP